MDSFWLKVSSSRSIRSKNKDSMAYIWTVYHASLFWSSTPQTKSLSFAWISYRLANKSHLDLTKLIRHFIRFVFGLCYEFCLISHQAGFILVSFVTLSAGIYIVRRKYMSCSAMIAFTHDNQPWNNPKLLLAFRITLLFVLRRSVRSDIYRKYIQTVKTHSV